MEPWLATLLSGVIGGTIPGACTILAASVTNRRGATDGGEPTKLCINSAAFNEIVSMVLVSAIGFGFAFVLLKGWISSALGEGGFYIIVLAIYAFLGSIALAGITLRFMALLLTPPDESSGAEPEAPNSNE